MILLGHMQWLKRMLAVRAVGRIKWDNVKESGLELYITLPVLPIFLVPFPCLPIPMVEGVRCSQSCYKSLWPKCSAFKWWIIKSVLFQRGCSKSKHYQLSLLFRMTRRSFVHILKFFKSALICNDLLKDRNQSSVKFFDSGSLSFKEVDVKMILNFYHIFQSSAYIMKKQNGAVLLKLAWKVFFALFLTYMQFFYICVIL